MQDEEGTRSILEHLAKSLKPRNSFAACNLRQNPGKAAALSDAAKEPTTRLNANIPNSLYRQLKIKAAGDDLTINDLVEQWVRDYVNV